MAVNNPAGPPPQTMAGTCFGVGRSSSSFFVLNDDDDDNWNIRVVDDFTRVNGGRPSGAQAWTLGIPSTIPTYKACSSIQLNEEDLSILLFVVILVEAKQRQFGGSTMGLRLVEDGSLLRLLLLFWIVMELDS